MAIDTTPSTVATSALQAIPFGSLIGAPLAACIDAQGKAAKATLDYINAVGLNTDKDGNKSAVNVTFTYSKTIPGQTAGQLVNITVPLLTIVPIPYLRVDELAIKFKANISADAATSSVEKNSTAFSAGGKLTGKLWVLDLSFNASYSSKKDSTAMAESKYAVEYTMDVELKATNDAMPAGLAKVLSILSESVASVPQAKITVALDNGNWKATIKDAAGAPIGNVSLDFKIIDGNATVDGAVAPNEGDTPVKTVVTAADGTASVKVTPAAQNAMRSTLLVVYSGTGATSTTATIDAH